MPFCLSSSIWPEDVWGYGEQPEDEWVYETYEPLSVEQLREAIASVRRDPSLEYHPRVSLSDERRLFDQALKGPSKELVAYRSGRVEWCPTSNNPGYDLEAPYLWGNEDKILELWLAFLRGDLAAIEAAPWRRGCVSHCPVCGFDLGFPAFGERGEYPDYSICPCCGTEFGVGGADQGRGGAYRDSWLASGAPWSRPDRRPADWSLEEQLKLVPTDLPYSWHTNWPDLIE